MPKLKEVNTALTLSMHNRFTALREGLWKSFHFFFWVFLVLAPRHVGVPGQQMKPDLSLSFTFLHCQLMQLAEPPKHFQMLCLQVVILNLSIIWCLLQTRCCLSNKVDVMGFAGLLLTGIWTSSYLAYIPKQFTNTLLMEKAQCSAPCWSWVNKKQVIA